MKTCGAAPLGGVAFVSRSACLFGTCACTCLRYEKAQVCTTRAGAHLMPSCHLVSVVDSKGQAQIDLGRCVELALSLRGHAAARMVRQQGHGGWLPRAKPGFPTFDAAERRVHPAERWVGLAGNCGLGCDAMRCDAICVADRTGMWTKYARRLRDKAAKHGQTTSSTT